MDHLTKIQFNYQILHLICTDINIEFSYYQRLRKIVRISYQRRKQTDLHNFHEKYDKIFQFPCESKTENKLTTIIADFSFQI